jgi:hypothetical protein
MVIGAAAPPPGALAVRSIEFADMVPAGIKALAEGTGDQ